MCGIVDFTVGKPELKLQFCSGLSTRPWAGYGPVPAPWSLPGDHRTVVHKRED